MLQHYTFLVISTIVFLYGYFPINISDSSTKVGLPSSIKDYIFNEKTLYDGEFDKAVIVIIDALRYDFIKQSKTPFIWEMSNGNNGCLSKVRVETPTVTLPRIKSLINGYIPQFADVVLNFIRNEQIEDSFIHNAIKRNKSVIFYGDDTWLKLFPNSFKRSEGTTSFFVNDYTEVDFNVTRNVRTEIHNKDWNIMILHYLGLDHIGHLSGPFSPLIGPKLQEMDTIIKYIYEQLQEKGQRSLILITGDHGMRDNGGHGGASYSEMHVPLAMLGHNCIATSLSQVDIIPTISTLLGIEIPKANIGAIKVELLGNIPNHKLFYKLHYNFLQLTSKFNTEILEKVENEYYDYLVKQHNNTEHLLEMYKSSIDEISRILRSNVIIQNEEALVLSMLCMLNLLLIYIQPVAASSRALDWILLIATLFQSANFLATNVFHIVILGLLSLRILFNFTRIVRDFEMFRKVNSSAFIIALTVFQPFLFLSSSFIEEEHQIWYYYGITISVFMIFFNLKMNHLCLDTFGYILAFRFVRKINQTGDKWSALPDLKLFFKNEQNLSYLIVFHIISLLLLYKVCLKFVSLIKSKFICCLVLILTFLFSIFNSPFIVWVIWGLICYNVFLIPNYNNAVVSWLLISALLLRQYNVILLPFAVYASHIIHKYSTSDTNALLHLWLGNILFFCQGHSNSLSSIDVAVGYTGLTDYYPIMVILQVLCHTYTFPILSYLLQKRKSVCINYYYILHRILCMFVTMLVVLLQRHHIFVWTVYAPKVLIETNHTIILFVILIIENVIFKNK